MLPALPSQGAWHWQPLIAHTHPAPPREGGGGGNGDDDNDSRLCSHMQVPASFAMRSPGTSLSPRLRGNNCRLRKTGWEHATQKPQPSPASLRRSVPPLPTPSNPAITSCCCSPSPAKRRALQCIYPARVSANTCIGSDAKGKKVPSLVTSPLRCERGGKGGYYGKLQPVTQCQTNPIACSLLSPA